jgi:hypothetical protein
MRSGPKATHGPFVWGKNGYLFGAVTHLRRYADAIWPILRDRPVRWLIPPDATAHNPIVAWTQASAPEYVFLANTDVGQPVVRFGLQLGLTPPPALTADLTTAAVIPAADHSLSFNGKHYRVARLAPGEGRVYRVCPHEEPAE